MPGDATYTTYAKENDATSETASEQNKSSEQAGSSEQEKAEKSTEVTTEQPKTEAPTQAPSTVLPVADPTIYVSDLNPAEAKVLVIDPGHCKLHPGAAGNGLHEEDVVLDISNAFYKELLSYGDITVYMTRTSGKCCRNLHLGDCLTARSNYAKKLNADFLVSIHINAGRHSGANALCAYKSGYHDEIRQQTQDYGRIALKELKSIGIPNRGFLLRKSECGDRYKNGKLCDYYAIVRHGVVDRIPSVIMENGYITSASDCNKFFKTKAKRNKVGKANANAAIKYFNLSKKTFDGAFASESGVDCFKLTDGRKVTGWVKSDGAWYYFDEGTGKKHTGFLVQGENTFYLNPTTGKMTVGWFSVDGKSYLAKGNGVLCKGEVFNDSMGTYLFGLDCTKLSKGFHTFGDATYYVKNSKHVAFGAQKIGSDYYGFDSETGKMLYGDTQIGSKYYYFNPDTGKAIKNTILKMEEDFYYYGKKGYLESGLIKYKGAKYYFSKSDYAMVTGWKKIKGKYYYFDEETGKMTKSKWIGKYYVNKKGVRTKKK